MDDPAAPRRSTESCRFGVFEFDLPALELRKAGHLVSARPQALKLLEVLLAHPGEVVPRADLEHALWDGTTFVDYEQGVNHAIRELRAALGDAADSPRFIQTLPRRGYRFIAPVARTRSAAASTPWTVSASRRHAVSAVVAAVTIVGVLAGAWVVLRPRRW